MRDLPLLHGSNKAFCRKGFPMNLKTVREAAQQLSMSELTIRKLIANKRISYSKIGKSVRVPESEITRLISESTIEREC